MKDASPKTIFLKEYQVPDFLIDQTYLHFDLQPNNTLVESRLKIRRNPLADNPQAPLVLDGEKMSLLRVELNGQKLSPERYQVTATDLTINEVEDEFELVTEVEIDPASNTSLEGLYKSRAMFCTQCEAEGFRRITYYLDRPDVLSEFTTSIVANKATYPILLSNGNCVETSDLDDGRHQVTWHDPFRKPAYLFALVAGDLDHIEDKFVTCSGREITLQIFVESKDLDKCDHAMRSLKNAMRWDEKVYGREYDLDIFMIVAVDDFNMGAMENKGLNIFNTSCVLAKPETTTDAGFQRVEGVVAHEYFHNWSGNRVTCRDWFQLSLKEGFTVFRDAQFSADMNSATVKRVEDVSLLRTLQFAEDAGPMAHPVRPGSFIEISNFYTLTVYEKGAEVVGMLHTLLGEEMFRRGSDLYFERHDGEAATIEDFVGAMAEVSGRDLSQFTLWYSQAGTPRIKATDHFDAATGRYTLTLVQSATDTPESKASAKEPYHIPVAVGLLGKDGNLPMTLADSDTTVAADQSCVLELTAAEQQFVFEGLDEKPVPVLLRGFSAPVKLNYEYSRSDLMRIMSADCDGFSRWDAGQSLAVAVLNDAMTCYQEGKTIAVDSLLINAFANLLQDTTLDKAMVALALQLPTEAYLCEIADVIDVEAIHHARREVRRILAGELRELLLKTYHACTTDKPFSVSAEAIAERSLKNICLGYLMLADASSSDLAWHQLCNATNMTDELAALSALVNDPADGAEARRQDALERFYDRWHKEALVVNQWLMVQAGSQLPGGLERVRKLMSHEAFDIRNPNKVRSLIGAFCNGNMINFHDSDGSGYNFLADQVIELDGLNPQIASRQLTPLTKWRKLKGERRELMKAALQRVLSAPDLSNDVFEVASKSI